MNLKPVFVLISLLSIATITQSKSSPPDQVATVTYAPTMNINPDEQTDAYPASLEVRLLISKNGYVEKVYFPKGTPIYAKAKVEQGMKQAKFTPYLKDGSPVKSIVPFIINFYILDEEEYSGD